jgi:hypothetical protein
MVLVWRYFNFDLRGAVHSNGVTDYPYKYNGKKYYLTYLF